MNKVIEVNDKYAYYTVEPGVSFFELYKAIKEQNKHIWCSVPALGWGSVVGNALDRVRKMQGHQHRRLTVPRLGLGIYTPWGAFQLRLWPGSCAG